GRWCGSRFASSFATGRAESVWCSGMAPKRTAMARAKIVGTRVARRKARKSDLISKTNIAIARTAETVSGTAAAFHGTRCSSTRYWTTKAAKTSAPARMAWPAETRKRSHLEAFLEDRAQINLLTRTAPAGIAGSTYPDSLDCDKEKKITTTPIQISKNERKVSATGFRNCRNAPPRAA